MAFDGRAVRWFTLTPPIVTHMARVKRINVAQRHAQGADMVFRDYTEPRVTDPTSPHHGKHPPVLGKDGTPATLRFVGADSPQAKRMDRARRAALQNKYNVLVASGGQQEPVTESDIADQEAWDLDRAVSLCIGWSGFEDEDDQPLPFDADAVRALLQANPPNLEDALVFIGDRGNFFGPSSTPSGDSPPTSSD